MKLIKNSGAERVADELKRAIAPQAGLGLASSEFSIFAFAELRELLEEIPEGAVFGKFRDCGTLPVILIVRDIGIFHLDADDGRHHAVDEIGKAMRRINGRGLQRLLRSGGGRGKQCD